jgi:hypothetical protein
MNTVLRCAALVLLALGFAIEARHVLPATGVAVVLGSCLAAYLWFLALARRQLEASQRRRG